MESIKPWHSSFMKYCMILIIVGVCLMVLELYLRGKKIDELQEENALISSNLTYVLNQLQQTQKAMEERELEYRVIEGKFESLNKELQEIEKNANEEEKNWLEGIIPTSIDNTIPY